MKIFARIYNKHIFNVLMGMLMSAVSSMSLAGSNIGISEIKDLNDIVEFVDNQTLVLFDLDKTLITAETDYGSADWFYCIIESELRDGKTKQQAIIDNYPRWVLSQKIVKPKATQSNINYLLQKLNQEAFDYVALTSRQPVVANETLNQLKQLGFEFSRVKKSFDYHGIYPAKYIDGVIFAHDLNRKGEIFKMWYPDYIMESLAPKKIKTVIFVDDSKRHVEDMANVVSSLGMNYYGFHYTGFENTQFNCEVANNEEYLVKQSIQNISEYNQS